MAQNLPLELVREIFSAATEVFLVTDRATALNVALTSTLGYRAAIPVLYRTLNIDQRNSSATRYLFDGQTFSSIGLGGLLGEPPARRLCPLVQRLFLGDGHGIKPKDLASLVTLERLASYQDLDGNIVRDVAPTLKHFIVLGGSLLNHHIPSLTHVSCYFNVNSSGTSLNNMVHGMSARTVTHITLDVNDYVTAQAVSDLRTLLQVILARRETIRLALHLFSIALEDGNKTAVLRMLREVIQSDEDRKKLLIWYDKRPMLEYEEDARACLEDLTLGRNAWTEGHRVTEEELFETQ